MARYALIADIHANLDALEAVVNDMDMVGYDAVICLGDVVGYGPEPARCLELISDLADVMVLGNHDEAVLREDVSARFNPRARRSIEYTRSKMNEYHIALLRSMPYRAELDGFSIAHATFSPTRFEYLYTAEAAADAFNYMPAHVGLIGHTHLPSAFAAPVAQNVQAGEVTVAQLAPGQALRYNDGRRYILNPGSVGQPRDRNPDASWALLDSDQKRVQIRRVDYDIDAVSRKIRERGLPEQHGQRLRIGA
ncbi:MAG: metallophosphoesterase family protein [Phycisphaerales bacterium]